MLNDLIKLWSIPIPAEMAKKCSTSSLFSHQNWIFTVENVDFADTFLEESPSKGKVLTVVPLPAQQRQFWDDLQSTAKSKPCLVAQSNW